MGLRVKSACGQVLITMHDILRVLTDLSPTAFGHKKIIRYYHLTLKTCLFKTYL